MKTKLWIKVVFISSLVVNAAAFGFLLVKFAADDGFSMRIEGVEQTPLIRHVMEQSDDYSCTLDDSIPLDQAENGTVLKAICRINVLPFVTRKHEVEVKGLLSMEMVSRSDFVDQIHENFAFVDDSKLMDVMVKKSQDTGIIEAIAFSYREGRFITRAVFEGSFFKEYSRMIRIVFTKPCVDQTECIMGMKILRKLEFQHGSISTYVDQTSYELNLQPLIDEGYEFLE